MRRWRQPVVLLAVAAAIALTAAGCGVPTGSPSAIPKGDVPSQLLSKQPPTTTTTPPSCDVPFQAYFVNAAAPTQLVQPVTRCMPSPGSLRDVLEALLKGPLPSEQANNDLVSDLGSSVQVLDTSVTTSLAGGTVATIDFNPAFVEISGPQQVLAVAQVVFTVAYAPIFNNPNVGVAFEAEGYPVEVPTGTGALVTGPVRASQYQTLASPP